MVCVVLPENEHGRKLIKVGLHKLCEKSYDLGSKNYD